MRGPDAFASLTLDQTLWEQTGLYQTLIVQTGRLIIALVAGLPKLSSFASIVGATGEQTAGKKQARDYYLHVLAPQNMNVSIYWSNDTTSLLNRCSKVRRWSAEATEQREPTRNARRVRSRLHLELSYFVSARGCRAIRSGFSTGRADFDLAQNFPLKKFGPRVVFGLQAAGLGRKRNENSN
jgi:hypothetical protein